MPPGFRKLAGYRALAALVAALRAHDAQPDRSNGKLDKAQDAAWLTMLLLLNSNSEPDIASFDAQNARLIQLPNLSAARAFAFAASSARFLDGTFVSSEPRRRVEIPAISSTAAMNEAWFAFDGLLKPLIFLTNCSDAARISSAVTGGSKLKSILIFLHIRHNLRSLRILKGVPKEH